MCLSGAPAPLKKDPNTTTAETARPRNLPLYPPHPPPALPLPSPRPPMPTMLRGPPADNAPRPPSKGANDCETNGSRESTCNETILSNASDAKQHHFKTCVNAWAGVHLFLDHADPALPYFRMLFLNPHKMNYCYEPNARKHRSRPKLLKRPRKQTRYLETSLPCTSVNNTQHESIPCNLPPPPPYTQTHAHTHTSN